MTYISSIRSSSTSSLRGADSSVSLPVADRAVAGREIGILARKRHACPMGGGATPTAAEWKPTCLKRPDGGRDTTGLSNMLSWGSFGSPLTVRRPITEPAMSLRSMGGAYRSRRGTCRHQEWVSKQWAHTAMRPNSSCPPRGQRLCFPLSTAYPCLVSVLEFVFATHVLRSTGEG